VIKNGLPAKEPAIPHGENCNAYYFCMAPDAVKAQREKSRHPRQTLTPQLVLPLSKWGLLIAAALAFSPSLYICGTRGI
jgi:hypothetical protein